MKTTEKLEDLAGKTDVKLTSMITKAVFLPIKAIRELYNIYEEARGFYLRTIYDI